MGIQHEIDQRPLGRLQIIAISMCIALNALDGFDVLSIAFASPGIATEWGVNRTALGLVLAMELIGMAFGAIVLGRFADKVGRRTTILVSLVIMTIGMFAAGTAVGVTDLSLYRLFTGLGIGGMLASTNAMVSEYANKKYRNTAVALMVGGFPLGIIIGGSVSAQLLELYSWRSVFFLGGGVTAVFICLTFWLLPESIAFLSKVQPRGAIDKINSIVKKIGIKQIDSLPHHEEAEKVGVSTLFSPLLLVTTILLCLAYFSHITTYYFFMKWVPKIVVDLGYIASIAGAVLVWANVGGLISSILMGLFSHRLSMRSLTLIVLFGCAGAVVVFGGGASDIMDLKLKATVVGFFSQAAVVGLYALIVECFATEVRATATGVIIGIGRGGAVLGPTLAGLLMTKGFELQVVASVMALGSAIAFIAILKLSSNKNVSSA